jgi:hypothetical protein
LILGTNDLREGWPWTPPITLLGKSCLCFLEDDAAKQLYRLLERPLSHRILLKYAPLFAEYAAKCLEEIQLGLFKRKSGISMRGGSSNSDIGYQTDNENGDEESADDDINASYKLKWEALRSYTFDLVDGPLLATNTWNQEKSIDELKRTRRRKLPSRDMMLKYMERMKLGLDVIKVTFGPEWMYFWMMNEYGRALNARMHLEAIVQDHIARMSAEVPVHRERGHPFRDPTTQTIPLLALRKNILRNSEDIFGVQISSRPTDISEKASVDPVLSRPRSFTLPECMLRHQSSDEDCVHEPTGDYVDTFHTEQDLDRPRCYQRSSGLGSPPRRVPFLQMSLRSSGDLIKCISSPNVSPTTVSNDTKVELQTTTLSCKLQDFREITGSTVSSEDHDSAENFSPQLYQAMDSAQKSCGSHSPFRQKKRRAQVRPPKIETMSLLERILRQQDDNGNGVSQVVAMEIAIALWMIMDAGNAWTVMALNLLSKDSKATELVLEELDNLELEYGSDELFSPIVLGKMLYLDALIYEAIRLCPPFLGGLKVTSETVVFEDEGIQVPKGSHVFFCQPSARNFNILDAVGERPENLAEQYPCLEIFGFLPFHGLEIPLMVLQSKVFLITVLRRFTPLTSKKRTFIRRVKSVVAEKILQSPLLRNKSGSSKPGEDRPDNSEDQHLNHTDGNRSFQSQHCSEDLETGCLPVVDSIGGVTSVDAMRLFTKIPFPEPKKVVYLIPRFE